jgi:GT2 family glycosyltransferase
VSKALSVVVLGFKNFETVSRPCLDSLQPWLNHPAIEVLVVDNGSPDGSADLTQQWCLAHPEAHCLLSESNRGFAGGMNWGANHAIGDWLLLVNNDTVFPALALDSLLRVLETAPANVAMLGPATNAAGNGQALHQQPTGQLMPAYRCDFFCIAIRRDVWKQLGGLDEVFGLGYYEDFDFSLRLRTTGFEQMITEDVFVLHAGSATFQGSKDARALIKRNKRLLQAKHPKARFEHTRLGNLAVLARYKELKEARQWSPALQMRLELRFGALLGDAPRSRIKRWLWARKVNKILGVVF